MPKRSDEPSSLEVNLRKHWPRNFLRAKKMWTLSPYDWGPIKTSTGEIIKQGKDCTCMVLMQFGPKEYGYVMIYAYTSPKKPRLVKATGFPIRSAGHRGATVFRHKVYRRIFTPIGKT